MIEFTHIITYTSAQLVGLIVLMGVLGLGAIIALELGRRR